eukprot:1161698-Pelagomonas_calceolata.AAC.7
MASREGSSCFPIEIAVLLVYMGMPHSHSPEPYTLNLKTGTASRDDGKNAEKTRFEQPAHACVPWMMYSTLSSMDGALHACAPCMVHSMHACNRRPAGRGMISTSRSSDESTIGSRVAKSTDESRDTKSTDAFTDGSTDDIRATKSTDGSTDKSRGTRSRGECTDEGRVTKSTDGSIECSLCSAWSCRHLLLTLAYS